MKYIISSNLAELESINKKIQQYMIDNIKDYSATKWSEIYKHPTLELYVLDVADDNRNPIDALNLTEQAKITDSLDSDWYVKDADGDYLEKVK